MGENTSGSSVNIFQKHPGSKNFRNTKSLLSKGNSLKNISQSESGGRTQALRAKIKMDKLTEREKWLMNLAYSERGIYDKYTDLLNDKIESYIANEAPKPESIVKTVDPDNLPNISVFCIVNDRGYFGELYNKYNNKKEYEFTYTNRYNFKITHYIEQKDLIKLFSLAK